MPRSPPLPLSILLSFPSLISPLCPILSSRSLFTRRFSFPIPVPLLPVPHLPPLAPSLTYALTTANSSSARVFLTKVTAIISPSLVLLIPDLPSLLMSLPALPFLSSSQVKEEDDYNQSFFSILGAPHIRFHE